MRKLLAVLAVAGMILSGSTPAGAVDLLWGTGSPTGNDSDASGPSPVIFKFNPSTGSLTGAIFGYDTLSWMRIRGIADSGQYLYVIHNTWNTDSFSLMDTNDYKIAKINRNTGAAISSTSIAAFLGQTYSQANALEFHDGKLFAVENATSGSTLRGYAIEILLDVNGNVNGATPRAYIASLPDGALTFYSGLWYATSFGLAPDLQQGSIIYTSPDIVTTAFTQVGAGNSAVEGMSMIDGWAFANAGTLYAVPSNSATAVYSINLGTRQATQLYNLTQLPNITSLSGLANVVPDTTPPVVTVPGDMTIISAIATKVTFSASALDDMDGTLTPSCTPASGTTFPLGSTTVTCTATDSSGNTGSNSFAVLVGIPTAPVGVWAQAGDASATVNFYPPWNTGGAPITTYLVTSSPGGITASGSDSPITVTGLANGTPYTFTVKATNSAGRTSPDSASSNFVTPSALVPAAPAGVWATAGDESATVNFVTPWNAGSVSDITGYVFTLSPGGSTITRFGSSTAPFTWTGLTNGTAYTFTVKATNSRGTGPESSPSNSVTPTPLAPNVPAGIWAQAGDTSATVNFGTSWTPSGTTITSYTVTSSPGGITASGSGSPITVPGLTNGTAYTFTAKATNSAGRTSPDSPSSNSVTPTALTPAAPAGVSAAAGDENATVTFSAPWNQVSVPTITSYTVTSSPGGITASGSGSPITVPGLANSTAYTFTVKATNSRGTGPDSSPSNSVTPTALAPVAPAGIWAQAGDASATVHFSTPWTPAGTTIASYTVTISPGGGTNTVLPSGSATVQYTWTGLTNGTAYTFTAKANNSAGRSSADSPSSNSVTPTALVPAAPAHVAATAGDTTATITFLAPWNVDIVPAITGYVFTLYPGGATITRFGSSTAPFTWTGLTNGTAYTFTVKATNSRGTGPETAPSNSVTPTTLTLVPAAPAGVSATAGDTSATVTFSTPWTPEGTTITSYTVTSSPGGITASGSSSPITVTGLTNGTPYTFTVKATNSAAGTSPDSSASNSVTPAPLAPNVPAGIWAEAGDASATVHFSTPWTPAGTTLTSYTVTISPGGGTATFAPSGSSTEQYLWTGLTNGTTYTFTVRATNSLGRSSADSPSSLGVTPQAPAPATPAGIWAEAGDASATVHFTKPWTPDGTTITSYTVTILPSGSTVTFASSGSVTEQYLWTGLTNGASYSFKVRATNSAGRTSPDSAPSEQVTPIAQ